MEKDKEVPGIVYKPNEDNFIWLCNEQAKYRLRKRYFGLSRIIDLTLNVLRKKIKDVEKS